MAANVNTSRALDEIEAVLCAGREDHRCNEAIAILERWQWDSDLDASSRDRARDLMRQFGGRYLGIW